MKARSVLFSPEAGEDLAQIYEWIASAASPNVALSYINRIERKCASLDLASNRGQARDDIRQGLRTINFERSLTIAFTVTDRTVTILRIFSGGRDWEVML